MSINKGWESGVIIRLTYSTKKLADQTSSERAYKYVKSWFHLKIQYYAYIVVNNQFALSIIFFRPGLHKNSSRVDHNWASQIICLVPSFSPKLFLSFCSLSTQAKEKTAKKKKSSKYLIISHQHFKNFNNSPTYYINKKVI